MASCVRTCTETKQAPSRHIPPAETRAGRGACRVRSAGLGTRRRAGRPVVRTPRTRPARKLRWPNLGAGASSPRRLRIEPPPSRERAPARCARAPDRRLRPGERAGDRRSLHFEPRGQRGAVACVSRAPSAAMTSMTRPQAASPNHPLPSCDRPPDPPGPAGSHCSVRRRSCQVTRCAGARQRDSSASSEPLSQCSKLLFQRPTRDAVGEALAAQSRVLPGHRRPAAAKACDGRPSGAALECRCQLAARRDPA